MTLIVNVSDLDPDYEKILARMIAKTIVVDIGYTSDCYEWTKATSKGYGRIRFEGRLWQVHRVAWKILGPEPLIDGMTLDHLCKHHPCWNVDHLEQVTTGVNTLRGDGPSAVNLRKTQCPQGHDYTPENTYIVPSTGWRQCLICRQSEPQREYQRRYREAHKATSASSQDNFG